MYKLKTITLVSSLILLGFFQNCSKFNPDQTGHTSIDRLPANQETLGNQNQVALDNQVILADQEFFDVAASTNKSPMERVHNVRDYGAIGDGISDDTSAIKSALDMAKSGAIKKVFVPSGTYMISSLPIHPGVEIYGESTSVVARSILKRLPMQAKFSRMMTTNIRAPLPKDSDIAIIRNLTFDGSRKNQGAYLNYQLEQQHMIFIMGSPKYPGRFRSRIEDCYFHDGVGDAISMYTNADVVVENIIVVNVFRGGVVATGGNSKLDMNNVLAVGDVHPGGIDIEVDEGAEAKGYGGTQDLVAGRFGG